MRLWLIVLIIAFRRLLLNYLFIDYLPQFYINSQFHFSLTFWFTVENSPVSVCSYDLHVKRLSAKFSLSTSGDKTKTLKLFNWFQLVWTLNAYVKVHCSQCCSKNNRLKINQSSRQNIKRVDVAGSYLGLITNHIKWTFFKMRYQHLIRDEV